MRLISVPTMLDVEAKMNRRRKVDPTTGILMEFYGTDLAEKVYAILSHCWGVLKQGQKEVSFQELNKLLTMSKEKKKEIRSRTGYRKIIETCMQAQKDGFEWVWVDTCCIDKKSSSELSEAINSMYQWYENAKQCYTYIHDTIGSSWTSRRELGPIPKWFSRGWTLQELVAPKIVRFFDQNWEYIGDKTEFAFALNEITGIPVDVLREGLGSKRPCVAQIISWAARRTTTREEDRAYSLLGLLGVHMPMLYGEGKNAFRRLQLELMRTSNDQSIFAWGWSRMTGWSDNFLADDPSCFVDCSGVTLLTRGQLFEVLEHDIPSQELDKIPTKQLRTFSITNDGIEIWLPTATFGPFSKVMLACGTKYAPAITLMLAFLEPRYVRLFGSFDDVPRLFERVEFQPHLLPYKDSEHLPTFTFEIDDRSLFHDGFTRRFTFIPLVLSFTPSSTLKVTLSKEDDFAIITYRHEEGYIQWFEVLLSYCCGRCFAFILPAPRVVSNEILRLRVLEWSFNSDRLGNAMWHGHLPRSLQHLISCNVLGAVQLVQAGIVMLFVGIPGSSHFMLDYSASELRYGVSIDFCYRWFILSKSEVKLGDYGHLSPSTDHFERQGNIFELNMTLGASVPLKPVENVLSQYGRPMEGPLIAVCRPHRRRLALYDAVASSLPTTQHLDSLLKNLPSSHAGSLLVTSVVQCSECYYDDRGSRSQDPRTWTKLGTTTPLHTVMMPVSWHQVSSSPELVDELQKIRHNFSVLVGWTDRLDEPEDLSETVTIKAAIEFFKDIFGCSNFNEFVGEITFFNEPISMIERKSGNNTCTETDKDSGLPTRDTSEDRKVTATVQDQRIEALVNNLMHIDDSMLLGTFIKRAIGLRSAPFVTKFCQAIADVYRSDDSEHDTELDRSLFQHEILVKLEEIKALRGKFIRAEDSDVRRALAEDIAGKILLICWNGITNEIRQVLGEVVDRFLSSQAVEPNTQGERQYRLSRIADAFLEVVDYIPDDGIDPLQRMMRDATSGVSKHELLLAKRPEWAALNGDSMLTRTRDQPESEHPPSGNRSKF